MLSMRMKFWGPTFTLSGKFSSDNPSFPSPLLYFALTFLFAGRFQWQASHYQAQAESTCWPWKGRGIRFSPATAPGTPVVPVCGTLQSDNLRITSLGDGPKLTDWLAEKRPLVEPSSPTNKAEAPANDALVKKSGKRKIRTTYADKDPREIMKMLRRGNRNYIDKFDELLDGVEVQLEVYDHSPSPKHFGGQKRIF